MPEVIKFDGITGESKVKGYEDWIEINAWSWNISHPTSGLPGGGYSTDKASVYDISIHKSGDKGTIGLIKKILFGKHFDNVEIVSLKTTGEALEPFMKVKMEHVLITSVSQSGGGAGVPSETVTMACKTIEWTFQPQTSTGVLDPEGTIKIDLETYTEA